MLNILRRLKTDASGSIAITFALGSIPIFFLAGAAVDYARATHYKVKLQAVVDNSAVAALLGPDHLRAAKAESIVKTLHQISPGVTIVGTSDEVVVTAAGHMQTAILNVVGIEKITLGARAKAVKLFEGLPPCILALNQTVSGAITFTGSSEFAAKDCVVHSNSAHASGMVMEGGNVPIAAGFCSVGGINMTNMITTAHKSNCNPMIDPFAKLSKPFSGGCTYSNLVVEPKQTRVLKPGVYCGGLTLKGAATLEPGIYVIKNGPLTVQSQANVSGNGLLFHLVGTNTGFTFEAGGLLNLRAANSGAYGGVLIFQDAASSPGIENKLAGSSDSVVVGAIYTPTQKITLAGGSGFGQQSDFMPIIADQIRVAGSTTTTSDLTGVDLAAPLPRSFSSIRLIE